VKVDEYAIAATGLAYTGDAPAPSAPRWPRRRRCGAASERPSERSPTRAWRPAGRGSATPRLSRSRPLRPRPPWPPAAPGSLPNDRPAPSARSPPVSSCPRPSVTRRGPLAASGPVLAAVGSRLPSVRAQRAWRRRRGCGPPPAGRARAPRRILRLVVAPMGQKLPVLCALFAPRPHRDSRRRRRSASPKLRARPPSAVPRRRPKKRRLRGRRSHHRHAIAANLGRRGGTERAVGPHEVELQES